MRWRFSGTTACPNALQSRRPYLNSHAEASTLQRVMARSAEVYPPLSGGQASRRLGLKAGHRVRREVPRKVIADRAEELECLAAGLARLVDVLEKSRLAAHEQELADRRRERRAFALEAEAQLFVRQMSDRVARRLQLRYDRIKSGLEQSADRVEVAG